MFDLLVETIQRQASTGSFAGVGEVKSVEASSVSDGSGSGAGMPVGVAVGAVVALGALGALFYYRRKIVTADSEKGEPHHADTSDDESIVHAHAVLVEDDADKDKKKEEEGEDVQTIPMDEEGQEVQATPIVSDSK